MAEKEHSNISVDSNLEMEQSRLLTTVIFSDDKNDDKCDEKL